MAHKKGLRVYPVEEIDASQPSSQREPSENDQAECKASDMMNTFKVKLRVIGAIASKDLIDAFKNRNILGLLLTVFMIVALYRYLPEFESKENLPRLVVYDRGDSAWIARWDANPDYDLIATESQAEMDRYVSDTDLDMLGLILPQDFDQRIERGGGVTLDGYVIHWASDEAVDSISSFFGNQLSESVKQPVDLDLEGHTLYTQMDSRGYAFMTSLAVLLALSMGGMYIIPHLMFEEKQTRTIDSLMVSPATQVEILISKVLTGGTISILAGVLAFAVNAVLVTQWWMAILACLSGALFFVSVGLLVGIVLENRQQLALWGFLLMFAMIVPGLLVTTLETFLKAEILTILRLTPSLAFINLVRAAFTNPVPIRLVGMNLALLLGWAAVLYLVILFVLRRKDRANV